LALSINPTLAVWVVVATFIIQQLENNVLVPRIMDESVGVNPIVTLLSIAAFGSLLGLLGAILAIPMARLFNFCFIASCWGRWHLSRNTRRTGRAECAALNSGIN
jgi:predicted PurR-regulated permease PerM